MQKAILAILFLFLLPNTYSQNDSILKYLDDSGRSSYKNIIKTDIAQIIQGNIQLIWEHDISGYWRLETGMGLLTSSFHKPLLNALYRDGNELFNNNGLETVKMNPGLSLYISPRQSYIADPSFYSSANFLFNYYFNQLLVAEVSITLGKEINLSKKCILDINAGIGVDTHWSFDGYYYSHKFMILNGKSLSHPNNLSLIFPLSIKLGYRLN
jgi:hypothetical protein